MTTYDENGGYPHPDHIRTHETTMAAIDAAADPERFPGLGGAAWEVSKVYYNQQFSKARVEALHLAMIDADLDSPYHDWLKHWEDRPDDADRITTRIDASDWFEVRDRALIEHRTQIDPDGLWFAVPHRVPARGVADGGLRARPLDRRHRRCRRTTCSPDSERTPDDHGAARCSREDIDPDQQASLIDQAGPIAGLFVLALGIAMFFLWRSMSKQMKRIDPTPADGRDDREQALDRG